MLMIQKDTKDTVPDLEVKNVATPSIKYGWHNLSYLSLKSLRKNIFAHLFSVHNTISLSPHEQVCLIRLRYERYFSHHHSKSRLIKHICSWRDKLLILLKSLELRCSPPSYICDIKKTDPYFRVGWLHDEIVDSYLFLLESKFSLVLYCRSVEARAVVAGKSMKVLWKNQQLFNKELVFVPYNPSGVHWLLIVLNLLHCTIMLLHPVLENNYSNIELVKETGVKLLKKKFSLQNVTVIPANKHWLQEDGSNCRVYICYFAKRICEGLPIFFFR